MSGEKRRSQAAALFFQWLPMIYIVSGLVAVVAFQNLIALAGGTVLIGAGGIEHFRQQRAHREREAREQKEAEHSRMASRMASQMSSQMDGEGPPTQALMQLTWRESFECGHPVIDQQHKRLFRIGDKLINAVLKNKDREVIDDLLDELSQHITQHFATEESVMTRTKFPYLDEHKAQHAALLDKTHAVRERFRTGAIDVHTLVGFVAYELVAEHIIQSDLKFGLK